MSQSNMVSSRPIGEIRTQIGEAHVIAKAADLWGTQGQIDRSFAIALDIEELLHSTDQLLQTAAILNGRAKEEYQRVED